MKHALLSLLLAVGLAACGTAKSTDPAPHAEAALDERYERAVFAGGCFWCVESDFDKVEGVVSTTSGYSGGTTESPSYKQVTAGGTGHYEVVEIVFDPEIVSYETLVNYFFRHVDPTDPGGQFCDRGESYRTAIFVADDAQAGIAEAIKADLDEARVLAYPIVTPILELNAFWPAEVYHQDYYKKNPIRYRYYRSACGRDSRVDQVWGR